MSKRWTAHRATFLAGLLALFFFCAFPAHADCTTPDAAAGTIIHNSNDKLIQYCDGTNWVAMHPTGSGSGGCTGPAAPDGAVIFNGNDRVMQICAGNQWMAMGPIGGIASSWAQISAGTDHTCAVKTDGTLWCWGEDTEGQLGNGAVAGNQVSPYQESTAATDWAQVSAGTEHSCAIKADNTIWCWGWDVNGEVGNGAVTGTQTSPVQEVTGATDWAQLDVGNRISCAVKTDGTLWCWGSDSNGKLGCGGCGNQNSPVIEFTSATDWAQVNAGYAHTCAVKTDGTLWCWGLDGAEGRLGCGGCGNQNSAVQEITGATDWAQVSASNGFTCAVKTDNTLWCWGADNYGQLGNGAVTGSQNSPSQESTSATDWAEVSSGAGNSAFSCARKTDKSLWCWGRGGEGQLGNGTTNNQTSPTQEFTGAVDWSNVSAGMNHGCAIKADGTYRCWGEDQYGKLGNGIANGDQDSPGSAAQEATHATNWAQVGTGDAFSCAVKTNGTLWCWGDDHYGKLGLGCATCGDETSPMQEATSATNWAQVSTSYRSEHGCAVKTDNTLWCWGFGTSGQLGDGANGNKDTPTQEITAATDWDQVSAGTSFTCAVKTDNTLWCWGDDAFGQLGCNSCGNQNSPTIEFTSSTNWAQVDTGLRHACAVKTDGTLWCWGVDTNGRLGCGGCGDQDSPVQESSSATNWAQVSAGEETTCAVKTDNTLWCWGWDVNGEAGNGAAGQQNSPMQEVTGATDWKQVSTGQRTTCAVKTGGTLWCWGSDNYGKLGNGPAVTVMQQSPVQELTTAADWEQVSAGLNHVCAVKTDGTLYCWGLDDNGRLGNGADLGYAPFVNSLCLEPERWGGTLLYNSSSNVMQYCDGVSWVAIGK